MLILFIRENRFILNEPESKLTDDTLRADCGVVLTGSAGRIREAFEVLAQKKIRKLIVSGVYKETQLIDIFPHLTFYPDISENDIYLEKKSESTYGNAVQSLALVEALKCRDILLITSQLHMYRANRIFAKAYPARIKIKKMSVPNKKDFSYFDYFLETFKSTLYWALGVVLFSF
ncbi:MAG: YdcF family protein [Pseudobdellovibrio sp.]